MPDTARMARNHMMDSPEIQIEPNTTRKKKKVSMIFCDTQRLVPSPIVIREASPSLWMDADVETHSQTLCRARNLRACMSLS